MSASRLAAIFVFAALIGLWSSVGTSIWNDRADTLHREAEDNLRIARLIEAHVRQAIERTHVLIAGVDAWLTEASRHDDQDRADLTEIQQIVSSIPDFSREGFGFRLFDRDGNMLRTEAAIPADLRINVADRPYFRHAVRMEAGDIHISSPVVTRDADRGAVPVVARLRPNRFGAAVIAVGIAPGNFIDLYESTRSGDLGAIGLFSRSGEIIARTTNDPGQVAADVLQKIAAADMPMPQFSSSGGRIDTLTETARNGSKRIASYVSLRNLHLIVKVDASHEEVLRPWLDRALSSLLALSIGSVTLLAFGAAIVRVSIGREKAMAKALAEAERAEIANACRARFFGRMNHELRTPLNAIIGFSQLIDMAKAGPIADRYKEYAAHIETSGNHLLRLIGDIFDYARADTGNLLISDRFIDLDREIASIVADVWKNNPSAKGRIELTVNSWKCCLRADVRHLRSMLIHLIDNALKFSPADRTVEVLVEAVDGVEITVIDTGDGMERSEIGRVLSRHDTYSDPEVARATGAGLGLRVAKALIEAHGGALSIASSIGHGTSVMLAFPAERRIQIVDLAGRPEASKADALAA